MLKRQLIAVGYAVALPAASAAASVLVAIVIGAVSAHRHPPGGQRPQRGAVA